MEIKTEHDGVRLRNYRAMKQLTLTEAASLCGLSKSELSKLESGARPVRPDHVVKLAEIYGVAPLDLLTPDSKLRAFVEHVADRQGVQRHIPLYDGRQLAALHEAARPIGRVPCPIQLAETTGAYALTINDMANAPALLPGAVLHVHPNRTPVINDLVINRISWAPLIFYLRQSDEGELYGLTLSRRRVEIPAEDLDHLHKVVGIWMNGAGLD
jgi:transcriptional regulator with XRE-family HTH domain